MNYLNQPIKMTDWPVDARVFSRPTSKPREKRPGEEVETTRFRIGQAENAKGLCRGPFLESPGNFAGPKSNIQLYTDSFIILSVNLLKLRALM